MAVRRYAAFDIETAALSVEGQDWRHARPLGITCAAIALCDTEMPETYHGGALIAPTPRMTQSEAAALVDRLIALTAAGYDIVAWNGAGFDFDVLAEESGRHADCVALATAHIDPMFHVLCAKGFPVGLDAVARGMGIAGKPEGMSGGLAPAMWRDGRIADVLTYVAQDARVTLALIQSCEAAGALRWISQRGKLNILPLPHDGFCTVAQAREMPLPDTSWMSGAPMLTREGVLEWMGPRAGA